MRRINRGSQHFVISQMRRVVISINLNGICDILGRAFSKSSTATAQHLETNITLTENDLYNLKSDNSTYNQQFSLSEIELTT